MNQTKKYPDRRPTGVPRAGAHEKKSVITIYDSKKVSPKQRILLKIMLENPAGILSNELRRKCRVMNIHHLIRKLRLAGLEIHCEMEPFRNEFDEPGTIGRIRLASESRELARDLMGVS